MTHGTKRNVRRARRGLVMVLAGVMLMWPFAAQAQFDICGCEGHPQSLGAFDASDSSTYPLGTTTSGSCGSFSITIPLPEDGVMVFESFTAFVGNCFGPDTTIRFRRNAANTPVTMLVAGNVTIGSRVVLNIQGNDGSSGQSTVNGRGGSPGNGGFRGGDGGYRDLFGFGQGGAGLGAGGGAPGTTSPFTNGSFGIHAGNANLLPLIGGSGGGGGSSTSSGNCSAGGGGGGGGAILIAANGTITVNGTINADGGFRGSQSNGACSSIGGNGSGGAIRLMASTTNGSGFLRARGGRSASQSNDGIIRIESFSDSLSLNSNVDPPATRTRAIGQLVNPVAATVAITAVDGQLVPQPPTGSIGGIDLVIPAPGAVTFQVETSGVPGGTTVDVAVKPELGGPAIHTLTTLEPGSCNALGECIALATVELDSGAYFVEGTATYQTP